MSEPFSWRDFLVLAAELADRPDDEAAQRTAISRAYYATYCTAAEFVLSHDQGLQAADLTHECVWRRFQDPAERDRWRIFDDGMALRAARL